MGMLGAARERLKLTRGRRVTGADSSDPSVPPRRHLSSRVVTVASIILALAGVFVSYMSWRIAVDQNHMSVTQLWLMKAEAQPQFRLKATGDSYTTTVDVTNEGFPILDFRCIGRPLLCVEFDGAPGRHHYVLVPAPTAYTDYQYDSTTGHLAFVSLPAFPDDDVLKSTFRYLSADGRLPTGYTPLLTMLIYAVDISYVDALHESHQVVYLVGPDVSRALPDDLGRRLLTLWDQTNGLDSVTGYLSANVPGTEADPRAKALAAALEDTHARYPGSDTLWSSIEATLVDQSAGLQTLSGTEPRWGILWLKYHRG